MLKKNLNLILIVIGGFVSVYAQSLEEKNTLFMFGGLVLLMIGLMRLSQKIPSKKEKESFIESEDE